MELDTACESFLATQFGARIDFCCEEALPAVVKWGLASQGAGGSLTAAPLPEALRRLDEVWDGIFSFSVGVDLKRGRLGGWLYSWAATVGCVFLCPNR